MLGVGSVLGVGSGIPGFDNSSSAEATAGPVQVGGLTFAPSSTDTMMIALTVVTLAIAAAVILKRSK